MKSLFSNLINLTLALIIGVALSGCTVSNASMGSSSPWSPVDLDTDANPLDIDFVDDKNGFLVGTDRLILETNDGGITWNERNLDIPSEGNFRLISIDFKDQEGWIAGQPGLILHTTDGGKNWTRLDLGNKLPGDPYLITTIDFDSAELATTAGAIYKTTDGGANWEALVVDTSGSGGIRELRRTTNGGYVSVSSLGNFFSVLSSDRETWSPHQRASSKRVQSVGEMPNGDLWMLSRGAEIRFNEDSDNIDAWSKPIIPIVNGYNYQDLAWDPAKSIWAAGGNGTLLISNDDGKTWEQDPVGDSVPTNFIRILFMDDLNSVSTKGFVFGERGNLLRWQG
ncbi:photosynthesis system II assembly factor Ycf48 [Prochlorococcus marinus]|uniref:Photosystem II assembly lipoprotein Ycf48 n=1 Tax=Prochlorococcus marinus XMU1408 TaxID=2213228 RepID=A0A318R4D1_PROMR|nr:photosynthesis system II assembly factor Ycf48 [Prochlorococcus marinus]MBW3041354.1 photosystem II assembly protein [Prochlorococcus marinus str. XMU1408]PYE02521.1 photosystem II assembly protein [Prochlorococcus marinus XMU1408]